MSKQFITPNETMGRCDSESIQKAVDLAAESGLNKVVIPRMNERTGKAVWTIEKTIRLPSDMTVVLDNCFMQMEDEVAGGFFYNQTLFTDKGTSLEYRMKNIHIRGIGEAILDGGRPTAVNEDTQREIGIPVRLNSPIFFMNVEGFSVENIRIHHQRYWGMRFEFCSRGTVRDISFKVIKDRRNQDGINLRNGCHDILIENIYGQTGDDLIALSAIDTDLPTGYGESGNEYSVIVKGADWDIHDVTIRSIWGSPITHPLVALRNHNGAGIYNIHIENLHDTTSLYGGMDSEKERYALVHIGDNIYFSIRPQEMGDTHNITIRDLYLNHTVSAVQVGGTVKNMAISNIHAGGACRSAMTVVGDNWGDDVYGVKLENVLIDGVFMSGSGEGTSVIDFPYMMDGDYVRGLRLSNCYLENVEKLALVHEKCAEFDLETEKIRLVNSSDRVERTDRKIKIKRAERNLPPFQTTVKREDI